MTSPLRFGISYFDVHGFGFSWRGEYQRGDDCMHGYGYNGSGTKTPIVPLGPAKD